MKTYRTLITVFSIVILFFIHITSAISANLIGRIVDAKSRKPLAARVYIKNSKGDWFFVKSTTKNGSAVRYDKTNWMQKESFEKHTTVSAHSFRANLPPGKYTITVERGKE